ncbi:PAS/PAC sensor-containing diguanylate cyclase, partial [Candidatus Magnetomorum sp. HK-1]
MFNNIYNTTSKSIQQRLYLQTIIIAIFLFTMICISIWTENTLTMITAIARFERTHTVSRLEAKVSLLEYIDNRNDQAKESFYTNMAITQSYNKVFSNLLVMRKFKFENEFVKILETTFKEADHNTAVIIVNRIKVLYWHPIIKELVDYADKAHRAGEKIVKLAPLVMSANNEVQISSILREIERNEAEFVSNEHSFSKRCSDLSNEIANFVSYFSITILIFSVGFVSLITFLIAKSLLQQAVKHACDLEVSRRQYRNLVEGTPDLIIRIDVDGRFVFLNHAAKEIYGLSPEECIGRLSSDFIHPEDKEPTIDAFQAFLKSGKEILKYENRLVGIDGREHHMAWSIIAEKDENHIITGFASTGRDITERKQAEEALIESEERFKMVLDGSQLGYWDWDIETNVVHRNERWAEMIGYTLKEIELNVKQWTDLHHPEDRDATWQSIQDHLENRTSAHNIEYRMRTKNGDY